MRDELEVRIPGRSRYLSSVREFFRSLVEDSQEVALEPGAVAEVQLVLQEACVNAIRHGCRGVDAGDPIRVVFRVHDDHLEVEVHDRGPGFDPDAVPPPDAAALQEGGYGVYIMKKSMDHFEARRTPDGFMLRMTKQFRGERVAQTADER